MNQKANNNICTLCKNTFNPENFDNKKFDLITCFQFIKHIEVFSIYNNYTLSYWVKLFPFPGKIKKALLKFLNATLIGNIKIPINVGNIGCIGYKI